jgi:hypothetical protein
MSKVSIACLAAVAAMLAAGCSGKTERGTGLESSAEKPAAGPSNVSDPDEGTKPAANSERRHVLMVVELEPAARLARVLKARPVDLPLPRKRGPAEKGPWQVDVLDASGAVLYTAPLADAGTVRGEFPNEQGQLSGVVMQKQTTAVTLRLPVLEHAATVRVSNVKDAQNPTELGSVAYPQVHR